MEAEQKKWAAAEVQWVQQTRDLFTKRAKTSAKITSVGTERERTEE